MKVAFDYDEDDPRQKEYVYNLMVRYDHLVFTDGTHDIVVVIGGDGAMLKALKKYGKVYSELTPKLFGIGRGTVNFLMNSPDVINHLEDISLDDLTYHPIRHLEVSILDTSGKEYQILDHAYNDIALGNSIMDFHTFHINSDDGSFADYIIRGSGLCISTPIGSTAFNANNGGTILPLDIPLLSITGIVPNRDLNEIFCGNSLEIGFETRSSVIVYVDGHQRVNLGNHGKVRVKKPLKCSAELAFLNNNEFNKRRIEMLKARRK